MDINYKNKMVSFSKIKDLDLEETLNCGQAFRWERNEDNSYSGVIDNKVFTVYLENKTLYVKGALKKDISLLKEYFDLDLDYSKIRRDLSKKHKVLKEASTYAPGIRILKQDPFEAMISFIISQNNNISRIKKIIKSLCENFGEEIKDGYYTFPGPQKLASLSEEDLSVIKAGFRNRYILDAAKKVSTKEIDFNKLSKLSFGEAKEKLKEIKGVGDKVADCILLYGMHRLDAFPMDVWMKRAMNVLFDDMDPSYFGKYAGIAQQYIFHYSRKHKELFD